MEVVICAYDGKALPPGTTYLDCEGEPFCEWQCHDQAHSKCQAGVYMTTPSEPVRCIVCTEPIKEDGSSSRWVHEHGDASCGTGDGAVATPPPTPAPPPAPSVCGRCGVRLRHREGHSGRYEWEDWNAPDTAIYGSGSECPHNERGHEPVPDDQLLTRLRAVGETLATLPDIPSLKADRVRLDAVRDGLSRAIARAAGRRA